MPLLVNGAWLLVIFLAIVAELEQPLQRFEQGVDRAIARFVAQRLKGRVQHLGHQSVGKLLDFAA
jgi:O-acetyl-ADP-ribose deacetylase (regulator of RNase III)